MSYPPTEVCEISNDSIFSDSMEFDAAEKPAVAADPETARALEEDADRALPEQPTSPSRPLPKGMEELPPAVPQQSALLKQRKHGTKPPRRWEPVKLTVPEDDAEDEFDISTAQRPVYPGQDPQAEGDEDDVAAQFINSEPDVQGEITNCFDEPGLLYRIVDKRNKTWAFYNDSLTFEVHVECTFGKHSKLEPLENTKMKQQPNGQFVAEVVVYPCETELFVRGFVNGFTSKLKAVPLTEEYLAKRSSAQENAKIKGEMDAIKALAGDETDPEAILKICLENNLPFVDLSFPPVQSSIDTGAAKPFKHLPWARPSQYVKPELVDQIRLFRDGIVPGDVYQGELGDCWLMCALATQAENPKVIMDMFRHPRGPAEGKRERAIGAYRVNFNKNGLWRSVIVDDYLPVVANAPKFARSTDPLELWPSILEKAFAKLHRSYAMVQIGDPVHALTDMSGCPSMRFDETLAEAAAGNGADEFFDKWLAWEQDGYQLILTTPGRAPSMLAGQRGRPDPRDVQDPEWELLKGTGLLPGHAYSVLGAYKFPQEGNLRLVKLRNAWTAGEEWEGKWARSSDEWRKHPGVAKTVKFDAEDDSAMYVPYSEVLKYFNGGGVHFYHPSVHDYRVPIVFSDCKPSLVLELNVDIPTTMVLSTSNVDFRGLHDTQDFATADPTGAEYPAIMLSLATPKDEGNGAAATEFKVALNTTSDSTNPSDSRWTFLQAREIGMVVTLHPKQCPYLLIPRLMEGEDTMGAAANSVGEDYESLVNPSHFINYYGKFFPGTDNTSKRQVPVTLGVRLATPLQGQKPPSVKARCLKGGNEVFANYPKFNVGSDITEVPEEIYFQYKDPAKGYGEERMGIYLE